MFSKWGDEIPIEFIISNHGTENCEYEEYHLDRRWVMMN